MTVTINPRTLVALGSGLAIALIAVFVFQAWGVDAAPGDTDATFVPVTPCRLIDTRPGEFHIGPLETFGPSDTQTVAAHGGNGDCTIPTDAVGLSLNVTALDATAPSFLTIWPNGDRPVASSLNPVPGQPPIPNAVVTTLSGAGSFEVYNLNGTVNVIIDVNGYYTNASLLEIAGRLVALEAGKAAADAKITALEAGKASADAKIAELQSARPVAVSDRDNQTTLGVFGGANGEQPKVIATVTMTPAVAGQITANSVTNVATSDPISGAPTPFVPTTCSITTGTAIDANYTQVLTPDNTSNFETSRGLLSGTRTIDVSAGVPVSVNLVCQHNSALYTQSILTDSVLTAIFTPSP